MFRVDADYLLDIGFWTLAPSSHFFANVFINTYQLQNNMVRPTAQKHLAEQRDAFVLIIFSCFLVVCASVFLFFEASCL